MKVFSNSRLGSFENCPLAFKFHYIDNNKTDVDGIEAFMGSRVHDVLEWLYEQVRMSKVPTKPELLDMYEEYWQKNWHGNVRVVREGFTPENYKETGKKCLGEYFDHYHPFNQLKVVDTEMKINLDIGSGYSITGYIDRLDMDGDNYEIHDYKTSRSLPPQEKLDQDRQLALYEMAIREKWPSAKEVKLIWHFLQFDKEMTSSRTKEELETLKQETVELIETINRAENYVANPSHLCSWCDYQDICPQTSHPRKVDTLPPNEYLNDDGVKLVNTYADLYTKRQEINKELDKVVEAVLEYAKREEVSVIKGSDNKLGVKFENRPKVPSRSSDPEGFEKLKTILQEKGIWDDMSQVSYSSLKSRLDSDPGLLNALKDLITWEEGSRVTKSKLKR